MAASRAFPSQMLPDGEARLAKFSELVCIPSWLRRAALPPALLQQPALRVKPPSLSSAQPTQWLTLWAAYTVHRCPRAVAAGAKSGGA